MIEKLFSKTKMKTSITMLSILACVSTVILGIFSGLNSKNILANTEYIYSYQEYMHALATIESAFVKQKVSILEYLLDNNTESLPNIEAEDKIIREMIDFYNSTEYEDPQEEKDFHALTDAYYEYYDIIQTVLDAKNNGKQVDAASSARLQELEATTLEYLTILDNYLDSWALTDMQTVRSDFKRSIQVNLFYFGFALLLFGTFAIITIRHFSKEMNSINNALEKVSTGDLTIHLDAPYNTEFDQMKRHLNDTVQNFLTIINTLKTQSNHIEEQSNDLSDNSTELSASIANISDSIATVRSSTEMQACDIEETVSVLNSFSNDMSKFTESIKDLNSNSNQISGIATESTKKMDGLSSSFQEINEALTEFISKISVLDNSVKEISTISTFINTIAAQTNLLALNASIESARVGEAGKGFAVVASEIGTLADQSREASNNINTLIREISSDTSDIMQNSEGVLKQLELSMNSIDDSMNTFKPMFGLLDEIVTMIGSLATASERMTEEKDLIYTKMTQTADLAAEITSSTDEISKPLDEITKISQTVASASAGLHDLTTTLDTNINQFNTEN